MHNFEFLVSIVDGSEQTGATERQGQSKDPAGTDRALPVGSQQSKRCVKIRMHCERRFGELTKSVEVHDTFAPRGSEP